MVAAWLPLRAAWSQCAQGYLGSIVAGEGSAGPGQSSTTWATAAQMAEENDHQ